MIKRCKLKRCGHVSRSSGLAKTILQGTVKGERRQGRQKKEVGRQHKGMDGPGVRQVPEGSGEQRKLEETGCEAICGTLTTPWYRWRWRNALQFLSIYTDFLHLFLTSSFFSFFTSSSSSFFVQTLKPTKEKAEDVNVQLCEEKRKWRDRPSQDMFLSTGKIM